MFTFDFRLIQLQKVIMEARRNLLDEKDVINFSNVPEFIVEAFFGKCIYKSRLLVSTFCYLNGISIDQLFQLIQWKDTSEKDKIKIRQLYSYFELDRYKENYYSFNVHTGVVMYLNGDLRRFRRRVSKSGQ